MENTLRVIVTQTGEILLNEKALSGILSASQIKYLEAILLAYVRLCKAAGKSPFYKGTAHHEHVSKNHANKVEMLGYLWAVHGGKLPLIEISKEKGPLKKVYASVILDCIFGFGIGEGQFYGDASFAKPLVLDKREKESATIALRGFATGLGRRRQTDATLGAEALRGEPGLEKADWKTAVIYDGPFIPNKAPFSAISTLIRDVGKRQIFGKNPEQICIRVTLRKKNL